MNKKRLLLLSSPFICLLVWIVFIFCQSFGQDVILPIRGYDPRDLISGHYIRYQIDWDKADCSQFESNDCPKNDFCTFHRINRQCRFYIPEKHAEYLDYLFREKNGDLKFEVKYSHQNGKKAIAKKLLINGIEWQKFIKEKVDK